MSREIETPVLDPTLDPSSAPQTPTPPIEPPKEPVIDPEKQLMLETIKFQNARLQDLENRRAAEPVKEPPKPRDVEAERQEFFNDPGAFLRREMAATIAPLQKIADGLAGQTKFDTLLAQAKADPHFKKMWNPTLEEYVSREGRNVNPNILDFNTLGFIILTGIGLQASGQLAGAPVREPAPGEPPVAPAPIYLAPSSPAPPSTRSDAPKFRPLDENEKRMLREYNAKVPADKRMTEAQYRQWGTLQASDVASATFDRGTK